MKKQLQKYFYCYCHCKISNLKVICNSDKFFKKNTKKYIVNLLINKNNFNVFIQQYNIGKNASSLHC